MGLGMLNFGNKNGFLGMFNNKSGGSQNNPTLNGVNVQPYQAPPNTNQPAVETPTNVNTPTNVDIYSPLHQPKQGVPYVNPAPIETFNSSPYVNIPSPPNPPAVGRSYFDPNTGEPITEGLYNQMMFQGKGSLGSKTDIFNRQDMGNWDVSGMFDRLDAGNISPEEMEKLNWLKINNPEGLQAVMKQRGVTAAANRPNAPANPPPEIPEIAAGTTNSNAADLMLGGGAFDQGDVTTDNHLYGGRRGTSSWDNFKTDVKQSIGFENPNKPLVNEVTSAPPTESPFSEMNFRKDPSFLDASNFVQNAQNNTPNNFNFTETFDTDGNLTLPRGVVPQNPTAVQKLNGPAFPTNLPQGVAPSNPSSVQNLEGYREYMQGQEGLDPGNPNALTPEGGFKEPYSPSPMDYSDEYETYKAQTDAAKNPNSVMNQLPTLDDRLNNATINASNPDVNNLDVMNDKFKELLSNEWAKGDSVNQIFDEPEGTKTNLPTRREEGYALQNGTNSYQGMLDLATQMTNGDPAQIRDMMNRIAFHETGQSMDPNQLQDGGGPGKGLYQIEGDSMATAIQRSMNAYKNQGQDIPQWLTDLQEGGFSDATNLAPEMQSALALGNLLTQEGSTKDLNNYFGGNGGLDNLWADYHWQGDYSDRDDRLASFNKHNDVYAGETFQSTPRGYNFP